MRNRKWLMAATVMLPVVLCLLAGCQTTVPVSYTEPARLDLSGVNRVAIDSNDSQVVSSVSQKLTATGKYTVASGEELFEWKQWKTLAGRQAQAIEISAVDLVGAYAGNAVRADASYQEKTLKITAVVNEIGQSSRGNYFVRLEGVGNDSVNVFFADFEINAVAAVDKGQTITIIGECSGFKPPNMEDTAEILRLLGAGRSININDATFPVDDYPGAVDAVISLDATTSVQDDSHIIKRTAVDSNGNTIRDADGNAIMRDVTIYDRNVTVDVGYQVVRARDSSLIGEGTKSATSPKSSNEVQSQLPAASDLAARTIDRPLNEFISEIIPTQRSISITLAKESENKEAKKEMSGAEKLAKAGNYADAAAAYGKIYATYKNFTAGYNQAVLTEVAAGTEAAVGLMEALSKETNNPMALSALEGMQSRNAGNQMAAAQLSQ
jgi:hypothetical protein